MRHVPLYEQLDDHLEQRRITREARESEKPLLDEIKLLRKALQDLMHGYVCTLESARDRILFYGGQCDDVATMERGDLHLRKAREVLEATK
jgi:hypothetical protein